MSDTETRSVAEIIGWRWSDRSRGWIAPDCESEYGPLQRPITPDDMLAWLSEKVKDGEWNTEGIIGITYKGDGYVEVYWYCAAGMEVVSGCSTLHAALEAAVRAAAVFEVDR